MRYFLFSLLVIFAIGLFTVPQAFADHEEVIVENAQGSSTPGCEETADGCFIPSTVTIDVGSTVTWEMMIQQLIQQQVDQQQMDQVVCLTVV